MFDPLPEDAIRSFTTNYFQNLGMDVEDEDGQKNTRKRRSAYNTNLKYGDYSASLRTNVIYDLLVHEMFLYDVSTKYNVKYNTVRNFVNNFQKENGKLFKYNTQVRDLNNPFRFMWAKLSKKKGEGMEGPPVCSLYLCTDWEAEGEAERMFVFDNSRREYPFYTEHQLSKELQYHRNWAENSGQM